MNEHKDYKNDENGKRTSDPDMDYKDYKRAELLDVLDDIHKEDEYRSWGGFE